jgi:hypothetical protein
MTSNNGFLAIATVIVLVLASPANAEGSERGRGDQLHGVQLAANDGHDHGKDDHDHGKGGHDHGKDHGHDDKSHFEAKTFSSVKEAWSFLATTTAEAEKLLAAGKVEPIHELAEHIGGAVHTLEDKSDMVTGDAKTKLAAALKQLDKAADELHHSAEAKDADGTTLNLKKVKGLLPLVQSLYPAGAL